MEKLDLGRCEGESTVSHRDSARWKSTLTDLARTPRHRPAADGARIREIGILDHPAGVEGRAANIRSV